MQSRREFVRASAALGTALKTGSLVGAAALPSVALLSPAVPSSTAAQESPPMGPQKIAESLGITFEKQPPGYLNTCVRSGNMLITSGHTSAIKGKLGADLNVERGAAAARECAVDILRSVWNAHGTLDGLRLLKLLGCVNCTPDFVDMPAVVNGCSDLLHQVFGKTTDGWHARSAVGFASLPGGVAVEVEATFEIKSEAAPQPTTDGRYFYSCMDRDLPISKVVVAGDYLYTFGDGEPFDIKDPKPGMRTLFERMQAMLKERGASFADVVKVTALLSGPGIWKEYCDVYGEYFRPPHPCRTTIPVVSDAPFLELDFVVYKKGLGDLPCNSAESARESMRPRPTSTEKPR